MVRPVQHREKPVTRRRRKRCSPHARLACLRCHELSVRPPIKLSRFAQLVAASLNGLVVSLGGLSFAKEHDKREVVEVVVCQVAETSCAQSGHLLSDGTSQREGIEDNLFGEEVLSDREFGISVCDGLHAERLQVTPDR
jgi:hypothetical protein